MFPTTKMFKHIKGNRTYWFSESGLAASNSYPTQNHDHTLLRSADYAIETDKYGNQKIIKNRGFGNLERMIDSQFSEVEEIQSTLKV